MIAYTYYCKTSAGFTSFVMLGIHLSDCDGYARQHATCIDAKSLHRGSSCARGVAAGSCHYDAAADWIPGFLKANEYVKLI